MARGSRPFKRQRQPGNAVALGGLLLVLGLLGFPLGWHWAANVLAIVVGAFLAVVGNLAWRGEFSKPPRNR